MPGELRPLALTMGEPAGIGGELALAVWMRDRDRVPAFYCLDDPDRLARTASALDWPIPVRAIEDPSEAADVFREALPCCAVPLGSPVTAGKPVADHAPAVLSSIETAVRHVTSGVASAVVTNPIQKETLYEAGFAHPGHTEYLGALCGADAKPVMMLAVPGLRVVPQTIHIPIAEVPGALTTDAIVRTGRQVLTALERDFACAKPRLAVAGLNPHAGEGGSIGTEDVSIVAPAVDALRDQGLDVTGPHPADTLFHADARARYDAALCMYHDQALIPLKTLDFYGGVNITLGLPIVRTSPDHGTALDLAGTGRANPASLIAALNAARSVADRRGAAGSLPGR